MRPRPICASRFAAATVVLCTVLLAACTSRPPGFDALRSAGSPTPDAMNRTSMVMQTPVATSVQESVQKSIDAFNATAGGPVAAQSAELVRLLSPGQTTVQRRCAPATTTISFDPVYARLAPTPVWRPKTGTLSGTVYALPTLIRVYTGDRITGTDLTDLHIALDAGGARLPALCLG